MRIPYFMKDVHEASSQKLFSVISTFAGCGGSSMGYKLSGGNVLCINEFIPAAQETYAANFPDTPIIKDDIRELRGQDFLNIANIKVSQLDILDGSPPCASFSTSGKGEKLWGVVKKYSDTKQRVDDLFFEFVRILREIQPKVFVTENVHGLLQGKAKELWLNEIVPLMEDCGYVVKFEILNCADFGVPQSRRRLICVGVRKDINISFVFPNPQIKHISVKDCFEDLNQDEEQREFLLEKAKKYVASQRWYEVEGPGKNHKINFSLSKNHWEKPSQTILAKAGDVSAAGTMHPFECRRHTIPEIKRIMGFPEDFVLTGDFSKQYERLGRAVPPFLHAHVSKVIYETILKNVN